MVVAAFTKNIKGLFFTFFSNHNNFGCDLIISTSLILNGNYYYFYHSALAVPHSLPAPSSVGHTKESQQAVFAAGFGGITDLRVGPEDGDLYALSFTGGAIYRIVPSTTVDTG
jgi:aldose sugar dehydrogenase